VPLKPPKRQPPPGPRKPAKRNETLWVRTAEINGMLFIEIVPNRARWSKVKKAKA